MLYHIKNWMPRRGIGGHGFAITLYPEWKELVAKSDLGQEQMDYLLKESMGPHWLKGHGYKRDSYVHQLKVRWGVWGPEHITVPGSAAGLDYTPDSQFLAPEGGVILHPHNIDTLEQASLCLTIFTYIADHLINEEEIRKHELGTDA